MALFYLLSFLLGYHMYNINIHMNIELYNQIIEEYTKCVLSPTYLIEKYLKVYSRIEGKQVPFNLFPRQEKIIHTHEQNRFNLIVKHRQHGTSSYMAALVAVKLATSDPEDPENILAVFNMQDFGFDFIQLVVGHLHNIPRFFWGHNFFGSEQNEQRDILIRDRRKEIILPNHARFRVISATRDAMRGFRPSWVIMDEAAFMNEGAIIFNSVLTSLGTGGRATLMSTPNGADNLFHRTHMGSLKGENGFVVSHARWFEDPRYNKGLKWLYYAEDGTIEEILYETEFSLESLMEKFNDGYVPTSDWYEQMCKIMNDNPNMIAQELDGIYINSH